MKSSALPILAIDSFAAPAADPQRARLYYMQRLETHLAQFPAVSKPHAHSFYLLLYITQGQGTHTIDLITYDLRPGSLFLLSPGQAHAWHLSADAQGYIFFFSSAFYQRHYPAARLAAYPFFDPAQAPVLYLPPGNELAPLLARILDENARAAANELDVVGAYLFLCLELAARAYAPATAHQPAHALEQVHGFTQLLNQHFRHEKTVRYYAQRLHLTANHLNAVCRRLLNKTASDLIHERVVTEAQRLLLHSAQSVAQLADALGFVDASYFSRYFKKYVGQTPEAFRQAHNR